MRFTFLTIALAALGLSACDNAQIEAEQRVNLTFGNLQSQYQRRADLVPNLVETVKAAAAQEEKTLSAVVSARAEATQTKLQVGDLSDPEKVAAFQRAQSGLAQSLRQLLVVSENYPDLKATQSFRDLQVQLEGTENRIARAREEYNQAVASYNNSILTFPGRLWAKGRQPKQVFQAEVGAEAAPKVKF